MDVRAIKQEFDHKSTGGIHIYPVPVNNIDGMLGSHWHDELEIVYTVYGSHDHYINGEHFVTQPGRMLVVNSNFVHSIVPQRFDDKTDSSLAAIVIIIDTAFLKVNFPEYREIYFTNEDRFASEEIKNIIYSLLPYDSKNEKQGRYEWLHRNALITELLYLLCQSKVVPREAMSLSRSEEAVNKIKDIVDYINANYSQPLTRQMVAEEFYLSANYFSTYFKKYVGLTFVQYLTNFRLSKAKEQLTYTGRSIGRIALESGFSDDRSFIIAFKKRYGETPLKYRKSHTDA